MGRSSNFLFPQMVYRPSDLAPVGYLDRVRSRTFEKPKVENWKTLSSIFAGGCSRLQVFLMGRDEAYGTLPFANALRPAGASYERL